MKERSDTVRVFTYPKTWRSLYSAGASRAASLRHIFGIRPHHLVGSPFFGVSGNGPFRSSPRTYTVSSDSTYSIFATVIQRVICGCVSRFASHQSSREIA
jgi:hypothetical protein